VPDFDFAGLNETAQAAFKPHFPDVLRRSTRRRRNTRIAGAALALVAVAAGGSAYGLRDGGKGSLVAPAFQPQRTPDFISSPAGTPPPVQGRQAKAGVMVAGDLDHLYLRWKDCRSARDCTLMVAATADGGATWRSYPLPVGRNAMVDLRAVGPRTLVAWAQSDLPGGGQPEQTWHASADGGATWHEVQPRVVDAVPAGWRVLDDFNYLRGEITVVDPATGGVAGLRRSSLVGAKPIGGLPPAAGLWVSGRLGESAPTTDAEGVTGTGSAVEVSHDGGRTWQRHAFAEELVGNSGDGVSGGAAIATADGRTVYAVGRVGGMLQIHRSLDGGKTWQRMAAQREVGDCPIRAAIGGRGSLLIQAGPAADRPVLMLESVDGGATVREIPAGPGASAVQVPGGYAQGDSDARGAWLSADGERWSFVYPPKLP
jgi:photosystem II stability/assembly factor-like uncharacterized protein